jgi:predicted nucleotidyltransferase
VAALRAAAQRAASFLPSIRRIVLFGSLVAGTPTPRSDADLLVVIDASDQTNPRDRVPMMLRALAPLPCPVDLFVLTADEFDRAQKARSPLVREALSAGLDLL